MTITALQWSLVKVPNGPLKANLGLDAAAHGHRDTGATQRPNPIARNQAAVIY